MHDRRDEALPARRCSDGLRPGRALLLHELEVLATSATRPRTAIANTANRPASLAQRERRRRPASADDQPAGDGERQQPSDEGGQPPAAERRLQQQEDPDRRGATTSAAKRPPARCRRRARRRPRRGTPAGTRRRAAAAGRRRCTAPTPAPAHVRAARRRSARRRRGGCRPGRSCIATVATSPSGTWPPPGVSMQQVADAVDAGAGARLAGTTTSNTFCCSKKLPTVEARHERRRRAAHVARLELP